MSDPSLGELAARLAALEKRVHELEHGDSISEAVLEAICDEVFPVPSSDSTSPAH